MPVRVIGPPYKPTRHNELFENGWQWLRNHCVYVIPFWNRGSAKLFPLGAGRRGKHLIPADITFGAGGEWRDMRYGPGLHVQDAGYVDTNYARIGSVGLFAASTEQWTIVLRARTADQATDGALVARASATSANRTFSMVMDRINGATRTPRIVVRGTTTDLNWGLDDGEWHTYWVTWDGTTARAYYDAGQGVTTLGVGTAVEETAERIMLGARTSGAPSTLLTGDLDFFAILDYALGPAAIVQWQRDLYAPWRPQRRYFSRVPVASAAADQLLYAPRALQYQHLELWTDVESNGRLTDPEAVTSTSVRIGPIAQVLSLSETVGLDGQHDLTFTVPLDHPIRRLVQTPSDKPNLRNDQVVRLTLTDGSFTEHRIRSVAKRNNRGARTLQVTARSIFQDLGFRGKVVRTTADGTRWVGFEALGLTMAQHIESFVLPALEEAGQTFWATGTMTHAHPVDIVYDNDTPLSALRKIATAGGDLELSVEKRATDYAIHLLKQVGAGLPKVVVRARRNLLDLGFTESESDQATRIYPVGQDVDGIRPTMGLATWDVTNLTAVTGGYDLTLADPAGGAGPIAFDGQFLPIRDTDPPYQIQYITTKDFTANIVGSFVSGQRIRIETTGSPPTGAQRARIVTSALEQVLFVEHPTLVKPSAEGGYGVRTAHLERVDIPATDNLVPNPLCRDWPDTSPLPTGWNVDHVQSSSTWPIISRETNPRYWEHGGNAIRAHWPNPNPMNGAISTPWATIPLHAQGYLSFFLRVTGITGQIQVHMNLIRKDVLFDGVTPSPYLPFLPPTLARNYTTPLFTGPDWFAPSENDVELPMVTNLQLNTAEDIGIAAAWDLQKYPLYGGVANIMIAPLWGQVAPGTECLIEAAQITISPEQLPLMEGNGGVKLHQAANERVPIYAPPAPAVTISPLDLAFADGLSFPYQRLQLGGPIEIQDPDTDVSVSTRVVGWNRDWHNRTMPSLELSNQRADVTKLLARLAKPQRHPVRTLPFPTRGTTYAPA